MPTVLRDIVAKLGLDLDEGTFNKADAKISSVGTALKHLATGAALIGAARGSYELVEMAAAAQEVRSALNEVFGGQGASQVQDWAARTGDEMGRSRFQMEQMAGDLGKVMLPLMDRNAEAAQRMAEGFAQLAVDMASFNDTTDEQAFNALRSGVTGETEPLKRYGIVLNEARLQNYAVTQGIHKRIKAMTEAEKTELRYNFILDQAAAAQGDAARTSEHWTNSTKALTAQLRDMATDLGFKILPYAEAMVNAARRAITAFNEWQRGTKFLESALIVLGVAVTALGVKLLIAFAGPLFVMLKFVAVFVLAALVLDDFLTFLRGGDSVIGRFIDSIWGPGSASAAVRGLHDAWDGFILFMRKDAMPFFDGWGDALVAIAKDAWEWWGKFFKDVGKWIDRFMADYKVGLDIISGFLGDGSGVVGQLATGGSRSGGGGAGATMPRSSFPGAQGGPAPNVTTNQSLQVIVPGATAREAGKIADAAADSTGEVNRKSQAALVQQLEKE